MPPQRNVEEPSEAKIVPELAKKFNVDEVYDGESSFIGSLKSANDFNPVEVPSNCPVNFDMTMLEDDAPLEEAPMEGDQSMENAVAKEKSGTSKQNEKLYAEEGILNAKVKKAEKKRRKKEVQTPAKEGDGNDDYDFKVDYVKKSSAMDTDEDGRENENKVELPSVVDMDKE